jgi:prepilin signal peptidase PulO-like enzyme (type II secretory pathway)
MVSRSHSRRSFTPGRPVLFGSYLAIPPWLLYGFLFVLGSIIGSFLNVVIYRVPLGMSLSYPESRCPNCERPIRWYHNVPILGWLLLRGRCADCGARISIRYPIVEAIIGGVFVVVAMLDLLWIVQPAVDGTLIETVDLLTFLPYSRDVITLCMLFACAGIQWDGQVPPKQITFWALALLVITWVIQLFSFGLSIAALPWAMIVPASALGTLGGLVFGYVLTWSTLAVNPRQLRGEIHLATVITGAVVGGYGIVFITSVVSLLELLESLARLVRGDARRFGIFSWLFLSTLLWVIVADAVTSLLAPWSPWVLIAPACLTPVWSLLAGLVEIQYQSEKPPAQGSV